MGLFRSTNGARSSVAGLLLMGCGIRVLSGVVATSSGVSELFVGFYGP